MFKSCQGRKDLGIDPEVPIVYKLHASITKTLITRTLVSVRDADFAGVSRYRFKGVKGFRLLMEYLNAARSEQILKRLKLNKRNI